jgi:hypothetical protein
MNGYDWERSDRFSKCTAQDDSVDGQVNAGKTEKQKKTID